MNLKRFLTAVLAMVLVLSVFPAITRATEPVRITDSSNYNIAIVVDSSGSLKQGITSDPKEYRFEAISMFFDLMSDSGSNVCAVVFKGNDDITDAGDDAMRGAVQCFPASGMQAISSQADKDSLLSNISSVPARGYTDIGTAMLMAAERLDGMTKENGMKSIIVLFTDGATEFPKGAPKSIYEASERNQNKALEIIHSNDITLCAVYLNRDSRYYSSQVADLVRASLNPDPKIAASITDADLLRTKQYSCVKDGASLPGVFQNFYELISPTDLRDMPKSATFTVPGSGVDEINILITTNGSFNIGQTRLTQLVHETEGPLDSAELLSICSMGQTYAVYKLTDPTPGTWTLQWQSPDAGAKCHLQMNTDVSAQMTLEPAAQEAKYGDHITIAANLTSQGEIMMKSSQYANYRCMLQITNTVTEEKIVDEELFLDGDGRFSYTHKIGQFGTFSVQTVFHCGEDIHIASEPQLLQIDNHAPQLESPRVNISTSFGSEGTKVLSLADYIQDEDPLDALTIVPAPDNSYPADAFSIADDNSTLTLNGRTGGSGVLRLEVSDTLGSHTTMELTISYKDNTVVILLVLLALAIAAAVAIVRFKHSNRQTLRAEGLVTFAIPIEKDAYIDMTLDAMECLNRDLESILTARTGRMISIVSENDRLRGSATRLVKSFLSANSGLLRSCRVSAVPSLFGKRSKLQFSACGSNKTVILAPGYNEVLTLSDGRRLKISHR